MLSGVSNQSANCAVLVFVEKRWLIVIIGRPRLRYQILSTFWGVTCQSFFLQPGFLLLSLAHSSKHIKPCHGVLSLSTAQQHCVWRLSQVVSPIINNFALRHSAKKQALQPPVPWLLTLPVTIFFCVSHFPEWSLFQSHTETWLAIADDLISTLWMMRR